MVVGGELALGGELGGFDIEDIPVHSVSSHQAAQLPDCLHEIENGVVGNHQRSLVGGEDFERSDAVGVDLLDFFFHGFIPVGNRHVIGIVTIGFVSGFFVPHGQCVGESLILSRKTEVDQAGGPTGHSTLGAGLVVVLTDGSHKRHFQVDMDIDRAGE